MPPAQRLHYPSLDGLRGVAILLVLFHQFLVIDGDSLAVRLVAHAMDLGWIGVHLFFVLSGFLITGILLDTRGEPGAYRHFLMRRALRVFPLYYGMLVLLTLVFPLFGIDFFADQRLSYWVFTSNWTEAEHHGPLPHLWSLAVEEQFYLMWPLAALTLTRRRLLHVCIALVGIGMVVRVEMLLHDATPMQVYLSSFARMDALAAGGAVATFIRMPGGATLDAIAARRVWLLMLAVAVVGFAIARPIGQRIGYTWLSCVFALAIWCLSVLDARFAGAPGVGLLRAGWLRHIGRYSFAMYLFHKPLHDTLGQWALTLVGYTGSLAGGLLYSGLLIVLKTVLGALSYHFFERRFLALRASPPAARPAPPG